MPGRSLAIAQTPTHGNEAVFALSLPYQSGASTYGVKKTAQNFVAELLTQRGSVRFDLSYGSRLPNEIRGRNITAINDIQVLLTGAIHDVTSNMRLRETPDFLANELIRSVNIVRLQQDYDRVIVQLQIITEGPDKDNSITVPLTLNLSNQDGQ